MLYWYAAAALFYQLRIVRIYLANGAIYNVQATVMIGSSAFDLQEGEKGQNCFFEGL